jgi:hypothetical protein
MERDARKISRGLSMLASVQSPYQSHAVCTSTCKHDTSQEQLNGFSLYTNIWVENLKATPVTTVTWMKVKEQILVNAPDCYTMQTFPNLFILSITYALNLIA